MGNDPRSLSWEAYHKPDMPQNVGESRGLEKRSLRLGLEFRLGPGLGLQLGLKSRIIGWDSSNEANSNKGLGVYK